MKAPAPRAPRANCTKAEGSGTEAITFVDGHAESHRGVPCAGVSHASYMFVVGPAHAMR